MWSVETSASMWRITTATSLNNVRQVLLRRSANIVKLYHANRGCFGYRPSPQVTLKGQLYCISKPIIVEILNQAAVKILWAIVLENINASPQKGFFSEIHPLLW